MIHDRNFSLDLGPPWQAATTDDPEQYNLRDEARDIVITLSAMGHDLAADAIEAFAAMFVELRLKAEDSAAQAYDHRTTIYEPIVVPQPWGRAIAYYGHDETGRQFTFSGSITRHCVISLYGSSGRLTEQELFEAIDEVLEVLEFDRTPLNG